MVAPKAPQIGRILRQAKYVAAGMTDDEHFEAFVRANVGSLQRTAVLLTGSRYAAEELLQDTLARLYGSWSDVRRATAPLAYVRRSVVNRFVSRQRSRDSHDLPMWDVPDPPAGSDHAESVVTRAALSQLLDTLPDRQRVAVVMLYFEDLPDDQIADALGCRTATVRSLISRALVALRSASERESSAAMTEWGR
jgi:RNA polymerase sigma-70 factor (sigma-E family)